MVWTIQWYVFRELGKAFLLTAAGITAVLGMGGGVLNMIDLQNVEAGQLLRIMSIVLPVAATLALPIAALFSAAVTYGRFSADNEFVACRASGINIHWLFLPTVVISLVSALLTFVSINYVIPDRVRNLDEFLRADLSRIVLRQLQAPQRLQLPGGRYRIYAAASRVAEDEDLPEDSEELVLSGAAFAELDQDNWVRYGTAESVRVRFDNLDTDPGVRADFYGLSVFDRHRWYEQQHVPVRRENIPRSFPQKVKWLDLSELFHYRQQVEELPEIRRALDTLRAMLARELYYRSLARDFAEPDASGQPDCVLTFGDPQVTYRLEAEEMTTDVYDRKPTFRNVRVTETIGDQTRTATAYGAAIEVSQRDEMVHLELSQQVTLTDATDPAATVTKDRESFRAVALPESIRAQLKSISDRELLEASSPVAYAEGFAKKRTATVLERAELLREIAGVIHSRLALSISTFVLVILGAALGIVFRNSHVFTAFGISFVPSLFVIVTIIMGRQLAQNDGTTAMGIAIIWGGIVLVGGVDVWTLARLVRR
jgi:lipopolysaccharide export LptBFGC system permease protein LptF